MNEITLDNGIKSVALDFLKAGFAISAIIFVIGGLTFVFGWTDIYFVLIFTVIMLFSFSLIGCMFLIQQKNLGFLAESIKIDSILTSKSSWIDLYNIEFVKIIHIGNYQPKIIIKTKKNRHVINCSNAISDKTVISIKEYFIKNNIQMVYKDSGIRW